MSFRCPAVFPNPGGSNVKVVHIDKSKAKRILAEVTVHASVQEVRQLYSALLPFP